MTLEENVCQMTFDSAALPCLVIMEYNWWNEYNHGIARGSAHIASVIAMASGLELEQVNVATEITSEESLIKHYSAVLHGVDDRIYKVLTMCTH